MRYDVSIGRIWKYSWLLVLAVGGIMSCIGTQPLVETAPPETPLPHITVENLQPLIESDSTILILDVRTPEEYNGPLGHIESALLIPVSELAHRIEELTEYHDQKIYVVCRLGGRSARATRMLLEADYMATNVEGGMEAWKKMNDDVKGRVD
jgi:rhodanese-related sulfurtransferase